MRCVPEERGGGTSVDKVVAGVFAGDVGEPEGAFGIDRHPGRVDAAQGSVRVLHHPVDGRFGPAVGRLTTQTERRALLSRDGRRWLVFKRIEIRFSDKNRVRCGRSPLVGCETLILP